MSSRQCVSCGHIVSVRERLPNVTFVVHKSCLRCARCGRLAQKIFYCEPQVVSPEQLFCSQQCLTSAPIEPAGAPKERVKLRPLSPPSAAPTHARSPSPVSTSSTSIPVASPSSSTSSASSSSSAASAPSSSVSLPPSTSSSPAPSAKSAESEPRSSSSSSSSIPVAAPEDPPPRSFEETEPVPLVDASMSVEQLTSRLIELQADQKAKQKKLVLLQDEERDAEAAVAESNNSLEGMGDDGDELKIHKAGWIQKKGGGKRRANWTKRFLILRRSRAAYYTKDKEEDKHLKGVIDITQTTVVRLGDHRVDDRGFQIVTADRTYYFTAPSSAECDSWIREIGRCIASKNTKGSKIASVKRQSSRHVLSLRNVQKRRIEAEQQHQECLAAIDTIQHFLQSKQSEESPVQHPITAGSSPSQTTVAVSADGIPQGEPTEWSKQQVSQWLCFIGCPQLAPCFAKNLITGELLIELDVCDLEDMGIDDESVVNKLMEEINHLNS